MSWSAKQYVAFEDERTRPVRDLLNAVPGTRARSVVDLGCGPGNSTEVLAARFPGVSVTGLDSSPDMIEAARKRLPALRFELTAIETWVETGPFDVILANAVLHWVPGHAAVLPRLVGKLAPGGSLAVQMPDNVDEPALQLMREVAADGPWAEKLARAAETRTTIESASWYYNLLRQNCGRVDVWRTTYHHPIAGGADAVVECRGVVQGQRPTPIHRSARTSRTASISQSLSGSGVQSLPCPAGWHGAASLPPAVHRRHALTAPIARGKVRN
jgi:trans-aconitate 2-methyltransferase